jgi:hypothetical protein
MDLLGSPVPPEDIRDTHGDSQPLHTVSDCLQLVDGKRIKVGGNVIQHPPPRQSLTNRDRDNLFRIKAKMHGARSFRRPSGSHLSSQKNVEAPSPTIEEVTASKIFVTIGGT